jgi:hypothetical protein
MSIPNPLQQAGVALVVGLIIKANTGGDKTKEAARAQEGLAIIQGLTQINAGAVANGVAALQAALTNSSALDPSESIALQSILSFAAVRLTAVLAVEQSTLVGQLDAQIVANVLAEATSTCQAYLPKAA